VGALFAYRKVRESSIRTLQVCVLSDAQFRLQRPNWEYLLNLWFAEMNRVYSPAGVQWELVMGGDAYPPDVEGDLPARRTWMEETASCKADVLLGMSGQAHSGPRSSASPFGHSAMVAMAATDTDALAITRLATTLSVLFGASSPTQGIAVMATESEVLDASSIALIGAMRHYDFSRGIAALPGAWDKKAVNALTEAHRSQETDGVAPAHRVVARAYSASRRYDDAVAHFRAAAKAAPRDVNARMELAIELLRASDPDQAIAELKAAAALDPNDARPRAALGAIHLNASRIEEALDELRAATRLDPENVEYQVALGRAASHQMGRVTEAAAAFEAALRLKANDPAAATGLSMVGRFQTSARDVVRTIGEEVRRTPNSSDAHMRLGMAHAAAGDMESAGKELQRSIELDPQNGMAHLALARWRYLRNEFAAAGDSVARAEALGAKPRPVFQRALERKLGKN
jgi:Flp pilus assembly protein TadD